MLARNGPCRSLELWFSNRVCPVTWSSPRSLLALPCWVGVHPGIDLPCNEGYSRNAMFPLGFRFAGLGGQQYSRTGTGTTAFVFASADDLSCSRNFRAHWNREHGFREGVFGVIRRVSRNAPFLGGFGVGNQDALGASS